jgi:hypothetical protein
MFFFKYSVKMIKFLLIVASKCNGINLNTHISYKILHKIQIEMIIIRDVFRELRRRTHPILRELERSLANE